MRLLVLLFLLGCSGAPFEVAPDDTGGSALLTTQREKDAGPDEEAAKPDGSGPDAASLDAPSLFNDASSEPACLYEQHTNGIGGTWIDCVPLSTYNEAQAIAACKSSGAAVCQPYGIIGSFVCGVPAGADTRCFCWEYEGPTWGHVGAAAKCGIDPMAVDPVWR
jgi:hypothetical protein